MSPVPSTRPPIIQVLRRLLSTALALGILGWLMGTSFVMVDETEAVLVERLGALQAVYDQPEDRGLHFKLPWPVDVPRRFDNRVQLFDPPPREMFTRDKKNITVDVYLCWKIADAPPEAETRPVVTFFRSLGSPEVAEARLNSRLRSVLNTQIGQVELSDLLNVNDSAQGPDAQAPGTLEALAAQLRTQIEQGTESLREQMGIEIVDVRIRRLNLPEGNHAAVFERMRSERKKIAESYRSAGMAQHQRIRSQADLQYNEILTKARAEAAAILGEGEAEAIAILNEAQTRDPEFYRLVRLLDAWEEMFNEDTSLILSSDNPLLKLLSQGLPAAPASPATPTSEAGP